jgi:hypothetical protein
MAKYLTFANQPGQKTLMSENINWPGPWKIDIINAINTTLDNELKQADTENEKKMFDSPCKLYKNEITRDSDLKTHLVYPLIISTVNQYMMDVYKVQVRFEDVLGVHNTSLIEPDVCMKTATNKPILCIGVKFFYYKPNYRPCYFKVMPWFSTILFQMKYTPTVQYGLFTTYFQTWIIKKEIDSEGQVTFLYSEAIEREYFLKALFFASIEAYRAFENSDAQQKINQLTDRASSNEATRQEASGTEEA